MHGALPSPSVEYEKQQKTRTDLRTVTRTLRFTGIELLQANVPLLFMAAQFLLGYRLSPHLRHQKVKQLETGSPGNAPILCLV